MKKAFLQHRGQKPVLPGWALSLLIFAVIAALMAAGMENISKSARAQQLKAADSALRRGAVLCYALEGRYPPNLGYLERHYGIRLDTEKYIYHYQPIGQNLMPQIAVFAIDGRQ